MRDEIIHTSNREFRAASSKLQKVTTLSRRQFAHGLKQVLDAPAIHIKPMIRFDRVRQGCGEVLAKLQNRCLLRLLTLKRPVLVRTAEEGYQLVRREGT
jgi:hypothetical protein